MASSVKGIVVEIGGDTSGLQNALKKVNSVTASLSKELRGINSMLKLDPKNTELLAQKQKILGDEIALTSKKLEELKQHQKDVESSRTNFNSRATKELQELAKRDCINRKPIKKFTSSSFKLDSSKC